MTTRTTLTTVTFRRPFILGGFRMTLPAGAYHVETDEELLEGVSFAAYRRILSIVHLHEMPDHPGRVQSLTIDPAELDAAIKRDQAPEERSGDGGIPLALPHSLTKYADRRSLDRAENGGMAAPRP